MTLRLTILLLCYSNFTFSQPIEWHITEEDSSLVNTDRPCHGDDTYTLQPSVFQLETGTYVSAVDEFNQSLVQSTMLRCGLIKRLELRLLFEAGIINNQYFHTSENLIFPMAICSKLAVLKENGLLPGVTLSGYLHLPFTASSAIRTAYYSSTGILIVQHEIGKLITLKVNAGITRNGTDKSVSYPSTAILVFSPKSKLSFFGEYYAIYEPKKNPSNNIDFGVLYRTKQRMQFDVVLGTTLMPNMKSNFARLGFSYRFKGRIISVIEDYGM